MEPILMTALGSIATRVVDKLFTSEQPQPKAISSNAVDFAKALQKAQSVGKSDLANSKLSQMEDFSKLYLKTHPQFKTHADLSGVAIHERAGEHFLELSNGQCVNVTQEFSAYNHFCSSAGSNECSDISSILQLIQK